MEKLDINLQKTKEMFNKSTNNLYMKIYSFATENVNGYINLFDLKDKSLLTVGSSGDQILNSYYNGCRDITLLDINPFAKYYINLKIAGIISLDYHEFKEFFFESINNQLNQKRFNLDYFQKLSLNLKSIDYDSYYFFDYLFNKYTRGQITAYLMNDDQNDSKVINNINNYLQTEDNYNKIKNILKDIRFEFINKDIMRFNSNNKYDNIFLSNLGTIFNSLYEFRDLLVKLSNNNLNIDGTMLIAYLWNMNFNSDEVNFEWKQIYNMPATRFLLKDFITAYYNVVGVSDILYNKDYQSDLVLVYKK